jgi:hypothetical protein
MGPLSFLVLLGIAYLIWRVTDQLPDLLFRLGEVQRDVAEIRRRLTDDAQAPAETVASNMTEAPTQAPPSNDVVGDSDD